MTRCKIYPAEGALCGEHYIELNGEHVGTARADGKGYAVQFYHVMLSPDDLNDIHDALVLFKQSIAQHKLLDDAAAIEVMVDAAARAALLPDGAQFHDPRKKMAAVLDKIHRGEVPGLSSLKEQAQYAELRKHATTLTSLVGELIVGGSWFHSYIELEQHESNHVDGVDMLRKLRNALRDIEDTL